MSDKIPLSPTDLQRRSRKSFYLYQKKIRDWFKLSKVNDEERSVALALLGVRGHADRILWSDIPARYKASRALASHMARHQATSPATRTYYLMTFIDDCGTTSDRAPNLAIEPVTQKVRRAVSSLGVDAIVMLEVHPLMNYPGGKNGRSLLLHAHAIAWTDEPFDHRGAEAAFNASPAWTCSLGAKPVDIRPIDRTPGHMERVAHYLAKQTPSVKNLMPSHSKPGRFMMMDTIKGYRDGLACRIFEGQSQVELMSVLFGVGEGSVVRQAVRAELKQWHVARPSDVLIPKTRDVWAFWLSIRQRDSRSMYLPYRFVGGAYAPIAIIMPPQATSKPAIASVCLPSALRQLAKSSARPTRSPRTRLMRLTERQALKRKTKEFTDTH